MPIRVRNGRFLPVSHLNRFHAISSSFTAKCIQCFRFTRSAVRDQIILDRKREIGIIVVHGRTFSSAKTFLRNTIDVIGCSEPVLEIEFKIDSMQQLVKCYKDSIQRQSN